MIKFIIFVFAVLAFIYSFLDVITNNNSIPTKITLLGSAIAMLYLILDYLSFISRQTEQYKIIPKQFSNSSPTVKNAIEALHSPDKSEYAIKTLLNTKDKDAINALAWAMEHDNRDVKVQAIFALAEKTHYQDTRLLSKLLELLQTEEESEDLFLRALKALAKLLHNYVYELGIQIPDSNKIIKRLIKILGKPFVNEDLNYSAQNILVSLFHEKALVHLCHTLAEEKRGAYRIAIIETIERIINIQAGIKIDKNEIINRLIDVLGDLGRSTPLHTRIETSVSEIASKVLVSLNARDALILALETKTNNQFENKAIRDTLKQIGDEKSLLAIEAWNAKQRPKS